MNIVDEIEDVLTVYRNSTGKERPERLLFGRRQLQAFDGKYRPFSSRVVSPGPSRAYDGIPIVATDAQEQLSAE
jgi:hypothetical protein